ncbi:MAG: hypothetical protein ACI9UN_002537 [Granulosicoccus sp.]|jgi:hypothetical protein
MASKSTENKTAPTTVSPNEFIASIEHPVRSKDAEDFLQLLG